MRNQTALRGGLRPQECIHTLGVETKCFIILMDRSPRTPNRWREQPPAKRRRTNNRGRNNFTPANGNVNGTRNDLGYKRKYPGRDPPVGQPPLYCKVIQRADGSWAPVHLRIDYKKNGHGNFVLVGSPPTLDYYGQPRGWPREWL
jgi:hypothetical protein